MLSEFVLCSVQNHGGVFNKTDNIASDTMIV